MPKTVAWTPPLPSRPLYFVYACRACGSELVFMERSEHPDHRVCVTCLESLLARPGVIPRADRAYFQRLIEAQQSRRQVMTIDPKRQ